MCPTTQQHFVLQLGTTRVMIIVFSKGNIFCHGCQSWYFGQKNQKWKENCPSGLFIRLTVDMWGRTETDSPLQKSDCILLTVPFKKVNLYYSVQTFFINANISIYRYVCILNDHSKSYFPADLSFHMFCKAGQDIETQLLNMSCNKRQIGSSAIWSLVSKSEKLVCVCSVLDLQHC